MRGVFIAGPIMLGGSFILWVIALKAKYTHGSVQSCANCGYNLTGNVSGVCPECGTEIPKPANRIPNSA